jgi:alpha-L-fucosidase
MKKKIIQFSIVIPFVFSFYTSNAQWSILREDTTRHDEWFLLQKFTSEEWNASNFASGKELEWFNDARYGMFIHFGLSTYIGQDLSWGMCYTRKAPDGGHGPIADSIWTKYPDYFEFKDFDAKKWVEIAQKAGMKYIVTIAKHHDGFHLWDTKYSGFKVTNTPFGRDYLKEIATACHAAGMKFGIYYSQRDWHHPDYAPVDTSLTDRISEPPYFKAKYGVTKISGPNHRKYIDYQFNVVRELCTNYGRVDVFWFDACWWGGMFTADMWESEKLTRMIRQLQPGIVINNRASIPGDFDTPEQRIGMYQFRPWESCVTLCDSWSWSNTPVKPAKTLVKMLTSTACGNGNMLLSWGPKWEGAFDPAQITRLEEVGAWLKQYGYTIYNTKGGPWYPEKWGGSTFRGNKVFLHITGNTGSELLLPPVAGKILHANCLTGGEIRFSQNNQGVKVNLEKADLDQLSVIIEFTFEKEISGMVDRVVCQSQ